MDFPWTSIEKNVLQSKETNHALAFENTQHIDSYIADEISYHAMYGPFTEKPFPLHVSPLMVRDKQNSDKKHTIMDLSWPKGLSVNDGVAKHKYLGSYFTLRYPSLDHITQVLCELGPQALIYKIDISRAFRHLRIDPGDLDLLGIKHKDYYIDGTLPFGFRLGSVFFQRCSDAIHVIMKQHGFNNLFNYIDDLIYVGLTHEIHKSFKFLQELLLDLGLE